MEVVGGSMYICIGIENIDWHWEVASLGMRFTSFLNYWGAYNEGIVEVFCLHLLEM